MSPYKGFNVDFGEISVTFLEKYRFFHVEASSFPWDPGNVLYGPRELYAITFMHQLLAQLQIAAELE